MASMYEWALLGKNNVLAIELPTVAGLPSGSGDTLGTTDVDDTEMRYYHASS